MVKLLQKPPESRSFSENDNLCSLLKDFAFFQEREIQEQDFIEIVSSLQHRSYEAEAIVFNYGIMQESHPT